MKQNDKLLCIKSIKNSSGEIIYTKNKIYKIKNVYNILFTNNDQIYIEDNFGVTGTAFYTSYLSKYFISLKEIRKLKLQKLKSYDI